ncbi:unnamed protein product, partial [Pylaiella littoralis]
KTKPHSTTDTATSSASTRRPENLRSRLIMVPRVILTIAISGVVALQSAAGTPLRSNGAAQELAIGDRRTQAELFCNSIGCPDGF